MFCFLFKIIYGVFVFLLFFCLFFFPVFGHVLKNMGLSFGAYQEAPDGGYLRFGDTVAPLYVDQSRDSLDEDKTVFEEITGGQDELVIGGGGVGMGTDLDSEISNFEYDDDDFDVINDEANVGQCRTVLM